MTIESIKENMENQVTYAYAGFSFEKWLSYHDGTKGCYTGWVTDCVRHGKVDMLRELYDKLPTIPQIGTPATIVYYSDKRGVTITEVFTNKKGKVVKVGVKHNKYTIKDPYDGEGECVDGEYWTDKIDYFTLRRNGGWIAEDERKDKYGNTRLIIGYRRTYIDPSF